MENSKTKVTFTYFPEKSETFTLHGIMDDPRNKSEDLSKTNDKDNNHLVSPGLSDWWLQNKEY